MELFILVVIFLGIHAGFAFVPMLFFKRFTNNSKYRYLLDASVMIVSFAFLLASSRYILENTVTLGR